MHFLVEALACKGPGRGRRALAVGVDAVEQDLAGAQRLHRARELHRVDVAALAPAAHGALRRAPAAERGERDGGLGAPARAACQRPAATDTCGHGRPQP